MRRTAFALAAALAAAFPADAHAQQPASEADSWGLATETPTRLAGTVVDVLCTLSGDCPPGCGAGARQLGILRADGTLVFVVKNGQPLFNGAVPDLLPYCAAAVETDGLMVGEAPTRVYSVQRVRPAGTTEWRVTDRWTEAWSAANPAHRDQVEEWFRHDPRVLRQIERRGYLGLGPEADAPFIRSQ
jgi:hypothetical protein